MGTLMNASFTSPPGRLRPNALNQTPGKPRRGLRCSRLEEYDNASQEGLQQSSTEPEGKHKDIWRLFSEAQNNILYLNNQRLKAVEDLKKSTEEKQSLLNRIDQLEAEKEGKTGKDRLSVCWELLFRIDSMVLTSLINIEEASDLRQLVVENQTSIADIFPGILQNEDAEILAGLRHFSDRNKRICFHIIHICTEMSPLISVGSLALYVTGLSHALQRTGHLVEVFLPKYANLELDEVQGLREIEGEVYSYYDGQLHANKIWTGVVSGIGVTFIHPMYYSSFFTREKVYGYSDDFERFSYFSRASLDYIVKSGKQPDVIHVHNWETAIVGPLFWDIFAKQGLEGTRLLLTCQCLDLQCLEQPDKLALCGLDPVRLNRPDRLQDNVKTHLVNTLKGGVVYSNKVIMMSSVHSKERIINSSSHGFKPTLAIHEDKLLVSPFGFDDLSWDPSKDKFLPENYNEEDMKGKSVCKLVLQKTLGLTEDASITTVGFFFSELLDVDLENLKAIARNTIRAGIQLIVMIINKMANTNSAIESLEEEVKEGNTAFIYDYDDALSHLIFAGSDIILVQSFNDHALQIPLKALRYGAAPITLTSSETILRHFVGDAQEGSKFSRFISSHFGSMSLTQALDQMRNSPSAWKRKILDAMANDFSWDAECYDIHLSAYKSVKLL